MHDDSFLYYHSLAIEIFACLFMLIGSLNFALHFVAFQKRTLTHYTQDEESRFFLFGFLTISILTIIALFASRHFQLSQVHWIDCLFMIISMSTTTGFALTPFNNWTSFTPILIIMVCLIGGCSGSTTGGLKVLRLLLIGKQSKREFIRLIHPQAVLTVKMDHKPVSEPILQSVSGYVSLFLGVFALLTLICMALGNDFISSFSGIAAALANSGAGIGSIAGDFSNLNIGTKWLLIFSMILGRLELYPFFILFTRPFWEK